jgi:hypothetical protein
MQGAIEATMMTLGLGATHANVAAVVMEHLGDRVAARSAALNGPRPKPAAVATIPTPPVDSVRATVRSVRPDESGGSLVRDERLVLNTPPIAATANTISRTLAGAVRPNKTALSARSALFVTGFSLAVIASGVVSYLGMRARGRSSNAVAVAGAPVLAPAPRAPGCPAGTLEVTSPADHEAGAAPFCLDSSLVTTEAYKACSDAGDCKRAATENRWPGITAKETATFDPLCHERDPLAHAKEPMNCVDRDMAAVYCAARGGRLPTEREVILATHGARSGVDAPEWSLRPHDPPTNRSHEVGFRCARTL